jgi:hypothetical protein
VVLSERAFLRRLGDDAGTALATNYELSASLGVEDVGSDSASDSGKSKKMGRSKVMKSMGECSDVDLRRGLNTVRVKETLGCR